MGEQLAEVAAFDPPSFIVLRSETSALVLDHAYRIESGEAASAAVTRQVRVQFKGLGIAAAPALMVFLWVGLRLAARALARSIVGVGNLRPRSYEGRMVPTKSRRPRANSSAFTARFPAI